MTQSLGNSQHYCVYFSYFPKVPSNIRYISTATFRFCALEKEWDIKFNKLKVYFPHVFIMDFTNWISHFHFIFEKYYVCIRSLNIVVTAMWVSL